jgi:demethylmenaquinone methyltransferase/2-methoxy-6-polyprenyl-1,4-benzoquinol methylase
MNVRVFIQNEAGSNHKHYHDEKTLVWKRTMEVSRTYPFPYGFVIGTDAEDGCNVDCFVITDRPLRTGQLVECEVVGLMEQFEDGNVDHNVLAYPLGDAVEIGVDVQAQLTEFVLGVFAHLPDKQIAVGRFLSREDAAEYVRLHAELQPATSHETLATGAVNTDAQLIRQQIAYYQARSTEYDEWFFRQGRYDHGPEHRAAWFSELATVERALLGLKLTGEVLELACGTGLWTRHLVSDHTRVLAVDVAPEAIAIARSRVSSAMVEYVTADLFSWTPPWQFDVVFFAFWLSHVPRSHLDAFWQMVRTALKPGGTAFFVDSLAEQSATAIDHGLLDRSGATKRRLNDGREFEIVKVFHEPADLGGWLRERGWRGSVQSTGKYFLYGSMTPSGEAV